MFKFKQFSVSQERTAMKICSDSCAFGASISALHAKTALDIGTGTGLLSLMVAQNHPNLTIDAIEINKEAASEATQNLKNSIFKDRIKVIESSFQEFKPETKYDLIFSNPPFYSNQLSSPNQNTARAKHTETLPLTVLIKKTKELLEPKGVFWLLLPPTEMKKAMELTLAERLFPYYEMVISNKPSSPILRKIVAFSFEKPSAIETTAISFREESSNEYHLSFKELTEDFYLGF